MRAYQWNSGRQHIRQVLQIACRLVIQTHKVEQGGFENRLKSDKISDGDTRLFQLVLGHIALFECGGLENVQVVPAHGWAKIRVEV